MEAIIGLLGVLIGAGITWIQAYDTNRRTTAKRARYLAIRIIIVLDKFVEDCVDTIRDDGLSYGQRTSEGHLEPQVKAPGPPEFPEDVDWTSIDQELMYQLLSLPSEVEEADRMIHFTNTISFPPDWEDWFDERRFHYSRLGLMAYKLSEDLCDKYKIRKKIYNDFNPSEAFSTALVESNKRRQKRIKTNRDIVNRTFNQ